MSDDFTPADYVATLTMLGIVSVLGTIGNLLVVGVYLQHLLWPHLQRHSQKAYQINYSQRHCATLAADYDDTALTDQFCARQMTTPTFFILVLAIVDLIVCCFVVPLAFYLEFVELKASSELWCKLHAFGSVCNTMFSSLLVIAIALDRYFAICHPLKNMLTMRRAKILTAALAIFCCVYGILSQDMMALAVGKFSKDYIPRCHDAIELKNITSTKIYFYHIIQKGNSSCFVLSILVVLILYSLILRAALKAQRRIRFQARTKL
ncbi:probable G-protein coupled receptor No9 [Clonorchis sinensis]|uniref:Probable G-protein coupled receptor No9 n=1 Tax=Clonorchis sinensis TaxID=79923 RepID=G7YI20_CLOSI|nr:probable G-protein coupled receptor No9 [Clonorchis sinensis]